jgi:hypothetical protein
VYLGFALFDTSLARIQEVLGKQEGVSKVNAKAKHIHRAPGKAKP